MVKVLYLSNWGWTPVPSSSIGYKWYSYFLSTAMHIQSTQISTMFEEEKATRINFFNLCKTFFENKTLNVVVLLEFLYLIQFWWQKSYNRTWTVEYILIPI